MALASLFGLGFLTHLQEHHDLYHIVDFLETHVALGWFTLSALLALAVLVSAREVLWTPVQESVGVRIFGITYHTELRFDVENHHFMQEEVTKDLETIRQLGVDVVRTDVSWNRVPLGGDSALEFDSWYIDQVHAMGMKVMLIVKTQEQIDLYSKVLKRIDYIQITNEPNSTAFSVALGARNADEMIQKLISSFIQIHSYAPNSITVVNPIDVPAIRGYATISWTDLYRELAKNKVSPSITGFDSYPGGPYQWGYPSEVARSVWATRQSLGQSNGPTHPIWIIETGSPTYQRSLLSQANFVREVVSAAALSGSDGLIVYEAFDNPNVRSEVTDYNKETSATEGTFGLFHEDRTPKPAASEYTELIRNHRNGWPVKETSIAQFFYVAISTLFRLIMPAGGPMVLSELAGFPSITFAVLGLGFRLVLAGMVSVIPFRSPALDVVLAAVILLAILVFQSVTETRVSLFQLLLSYSLLIFLFLWCGTSQISFLVHGPPTGLFDYIYALVPSVLGVSVVALLGMPILWFLVPLIESLLIVMSQGLA
jgi:hypothetical protein